ncbi:MAG: prepilin-type N-terminal cleavage/methylation domain-containing protein [Candidatus Gottesmanbacteria bacterium]
MDLNKKHIDVKGFTLIELLLVIVVIGVLATVGLSILNPQEMNRKARDSRRLSDLGMLRRSLDMSMSDGNKLPNTNKNPVVIDSSMSPSTFGGGLGIDISKYIPSIPQDPSYSSGGDLQIAKGDCITGTATSTMQYEFSSNGTTYILRSRLESVSNCRLLSDDGNNDDYYELGTQPGLKW